MSRVATIPLQRVLSGAIQRSQQALAESQLQLNTTKKASDFADLGIDAGPVLSARAMLARIEGQGTVAKATATTLALYDSHLGNIDAAARSLRRQLLTAIGTGNSVGLQGEIEGAFDSFRGALNAEEGGTPLFAGSQTDRAPFVPAQLSATIPLTPGTAFANDQVRTQARISERIDVTVGIGANEAGSQLFQAFRTLALVAPIGATPTAAQITAFGQAIIEIDAALQDLRTLIGENGRKQNQVETIGGRAADRAVLLKDLISKREDADLGQVAIDLANRKTTLEASYSAFSQLSGLSLVNFLR